MPADANTNDNDKDGREKGVGRKGEARGQGGKIVIQRKEYGDTGKGGDTGEGGDRGEGGDTGKGEDKETRRKNSNTT